MNLKYFVLSMLFTSVYINYANKFFLLLYFFFYKNDYTKYNNFGKYHNLVEVEHN